jgi:hypothetical protein
MPRSGTLEEVRRSNREAQAKFRYTRYGLTTEEYEVLQAFGCAICGTHDPGRVNSEHLMIDHNHETGEFRGMLCYQCNVVLGFVRDDPERLRKAAEYLERYA